MLVFISYGCCSKSSQTWWLKTEIYSVLETRSLKPRCQQGHARWSQGESFPHFFQLLEAPGISWLVVAELQPWLWFSRGLSPSVPYKYQWLDLGPTLIQGDFILRSLIILTKTLSVIIREYHFIVILLLLNWVWPETKRFLRRGSWTQQMTCAYMEPTSKKMNNLYPKVSLCPLVIITSNPFLPLAPPGNH